MHLSIALVLVLKMMSVQSRPQDLDPSGTAPNANCICTPFHKCYDAETSIDIDGIVNDRINIIEYRPVNTTAQENEPGACQDFLQTCCYNLDPSSPQPQPQTTEPPGLSQSLSTNTTVEPQSPTTTPSPQPQQTTPSQISPQLPEVIPTASPGDVPPPDVTDQSKASNGQCGVRNKNGVGFTVDGFADGQAQYGEFPWMAALLTSNTSVEANMCIKKKYQYIGGGSLIDPRVVLTVAHKPYDVDANKTITVRVGEWNFQSVSEPTQHQDIPVKEVIMHPRFNRGSRRFNYALLILERPAVLGKTVGTICLPSNSSQRFDGEQCFISGWGTDIFGEEGKEEKYHEKILKLVNVNMVGHLQCQSALQTTRLGNSFTLHPTFVCAGDKGQDVCTGDGGSALVCPDPSTPGHFVQVGASAWGIGCNTVGIPGVYSAIAPVVEWIQEELTRIRSTVVDKPTQIVDELVKTVAELTRPDDEPVQIITEPIQGVVTSTPAIEEPIIHVNDRIVFGFQPRCSAGKVYRQQCSKCVGDDECGECQRFSVRGCKCLNKFRCNVRKNEASTTEKSKENVPTVLPLKKDKENDTITLQESEVKDLTSLPQQNIKENEENVPTVLTSKKDKENDIITLQENEEKELITMPQQNIKKNDSLTIPLQENEKNLPSTLQTNCNL